MTFEPTSIAFRLDDVIVQKEPAWPLYWEHSLVAWRAPLRGELPAWLRTPAGAVLETSNATAIAADMASGVMTRNIVPPSLGVRDEGRIRVTRA